LPVNMTKKIGQISRKVIASYGLSGFDRSSKSDSAENRSGTNCTF
jgi:hypothetical protein